METVPAELLEAIQTEHRRELAKRDMQLVRYRLLLLEHGIEPPDTDGAELLEMWRSCRHLVSTTEQFMIRLGSSKELLADWGTG